MNRDVISETLGAMRVAGTVVVHEAYGSPWTITIPDAETLAELTDQARGCRVVAFHLVERGWLQLKVGDVCDTVRAGEMAVCFGGDAHRLSCGAGARVVALQDVVTGRDRPAAPEQGHETTELICGVFVMQDAELNPLFASLPSVVKADCVSGPARPFARLLADELRAGNLGQAYVVDRTIEVLCAGVVRGHLSSHEPTATGFFASLRDERIRRAIEAIHQRPSEPWTLEALGRHCGLSRSRFAALFHQLAGESPMAYLTRWRIDIAARALRSTDRSVEDIAYDVGYESLPAFSRAFKRITGTPPAQFRSQSIRR